MNQKVKPDKPIDKALVEIAFFFKDRRKRDLDNYIKFLLDGMIKASVIEDDSFLNIELLLRGRVDRKNPRCVIIVKPKEVFKEIDY